MNPLITTNQLQELLNSSANVLICDCRFDLAQISAGREAYAKGHIPGAIHVDLDNDLSGSKNGSYMGTLPNSFHKTTDTENPNHIAST